MWARALSDKTNLFNYVEVPLLYTRKIVNLISKKDEPVNKDLIKASFDRLIIFKDKNGKLDQRIISFVPDKEYLIRHNGDISHNKINKLDKDFDGFLIYKTWDDKVVNRLRITNGKATSLANYKSKPKFKVSKLAGIDRTISSRPGYEDEAGCENFYDCHYEVICEFIGDMVIPESCGEPELITKVWVETICPDDDTPPGTTDCADILNFDHPDCQVVGGGDNDLDIRNKILAETEPTEMTSSVTDAFLEISPDGKKRKESYKWTIAGNPISRYVVWSHETGSHKKVGNDWVWEDLVHNNFSVDNKPSYMEVTVTENGQAIPVIGTFVAGISVKCSIEASVIYKGSPLGAPSKDFERDSPIFYIHP